MSTPDSTLNTESKLEAFLKSVLSQLKSPFPELKTAEIHGGRFTKDELVRVAKSAPAIYLTWVTKDNDPVLREGDLEHELVLSLAIATKNKPGLNRHTHMIRLTEALDNIIIGNDWGANADIVQKTNTVNLFNGSIEKTGITLSSINWKQLVELG